MNDPRPPEHLDGYALVRELGRGGMGIVYEARHPDLPRAVALKLTLDPGLDPELLLRFQREAETLAKVRHPGVVRVHALGTSPRGPYMVTDMVPGTSLKAHLRSGPLPPQEAAAIVRDLALAVEAVHVAGCLHRDLKPENVILTPEGRPVLLDFGLARQLEGERLTQTGTLVGTPAYMSPEQVRGDQELGPACDVYGLGAVLYATLTGRPPFEGALFTVLGQVIHAPVRWPETHEVPPALKTICERALSKAPDDRSPGARALADSLDAFLAVEGTPVRRPWLPVIGGVLLLLLSVGLLLLDTTTPSPPSAPPPPPPPRDSSPSEPARQLDQPSSAPVRIDVGASGLRAVFLDSRRLVCATRDLEHGGLFLLDAVDGTVLEHFKGPPMRYVATSESGTQILTSTEEHVLSLDLAGPRKPSFVDCYDLPMPVSALAVVPGVANRALAGGREGTIYLLRTGQVQVAAVARLKPPRQYGRLVDFACAADGSVAVACYLGNGSLELPYVWRFDLQNQAFLGLDQPKLDAPPSSVAVSPRDSSTFALGTRGGQVWLRSHDTWHELRCADGAAAATLTKGLAFTPSGDRLYALSIGKEHTWLITWSVSERCELERRPLLGEAVCTSLDLSPTGDRAAVSRDRVVDVLPLGR